MALRQWKRACSDTISWRQDQALNATIYILRETGPTGFLIKEEGESKKFKVLLGDPHTCTCQDFRKEKEGLCKHICWILLKKFRVSRDDPLSWQLGLVDRELNQVLQKLRAYQKAQEQRRREVERAEHQGLTVEEVKADGAAQEEKNEIKQRDIDEEDVCPICQEEFLGKRLPVTYCKYGCGNNVHIKCMKMYWENQKKEKQKLECPLCRKDFGSPQDLYQELRNSDKVSRQLENHVGTSCDNCHMAPIQGKCYKCNQCPTYHLCQKCFNTSVHLSHHFSFRQKTCQRWRPVKREYAGGGQHTAVLPPAIVASLQQRDIGDNDYEMLLQLDGQSDITSDLTIESVNMLPMSRVREASPLLLRGEQCLVCMRPYALSQQARRLPCQHIFHKDCIDNWLLHRRPSCPVDGTIFTNESVQAAVEAYRSRFRQMAAENHDQSASSQNQTNNSANQRQRQQQPTDQRNLILEVPGIGIARLGSMDESQQPQQQIQQQQQQQPRNPLQNAFSGGLRIGSCNNSASNNSNTNNKPKIRRSSLRSHNPLHDTPSLTMQQAMNAGGGGFFGIFRDRNTTSSSSARSNHNESHSHNHSEPPTTTNANTTNPSLEGVTLDAVTTELDSLLRQTHLGGSSGDGSSAADNLNHTNTNISRQNSRLSPREASGEDLGNQGGDSGVVGRGDLSVTGSVGTSVGPGSRARTNTRRPGSNTSTSSQQHSRAPIVNEGLVIQPQPPSIPLMHHLATLPPVGSTTKSATGGQRHVGRVRARQPLHHRNDVPRSRSRERPNADNITGSAAASGLYIGLDPAINQGML